MQQHEGVKLGYNTTMSEPAQHDDRTMRMDWITWILFLMLMMDSSWVLSAAEWTDYLGQVSFITVCAVFAGTALARSRFSSLFASFSSLAYGIFTIGWQLGLTMDPALSWHDRSINLLGRIGVFLRVLLQGDTNHDPLMFVLLMAVVYWFMAVSGSWLVFRRSRTWQALLLPGFSVVVNAFYYVGDARIEAFLIVYVFLALLILVRSDIRGHQSEWRALRSRVPGDVDVHINRAGFVAALALVGLAWISPVMSTVEDVDAFWNNLTEPVRTVRDRIGDAFGGLRTPVSLQAEQFGDTLTLAAGIQPEESLVMIVDPERLPTGGGRLYWRSRVYDVYEDGVWSLSQGTEQPFTPDAGNLAVPSYEGRETVRVTVTLVDSAFRILYAPSQPVWVNRTSRVMLTGTALDSLEGLAFTASDVVMQGEEYRARGLVASPDVQQLRTAGDDYPSWIEEPYLQLPENLPVSIRDLAEEITGGLETPYDRAEAITSWLRRNIDYTRVTDPPPEGEDPLEWFLFDYRTGFCNYYASAEVILLRSVGIPARMAAGYARGTYDAITGVYRVFGADAHTWPEVYFPGIGWVEFEPTVSQPVLSRPEPEDDNVEPGGFLAEPGEAPGETDPFERLEERLDLQDEPVELTLPDEQRPIWPWFLIPVAALIAAIIYKRLNPAGWLRLRRAVDKNLVRFGVNGGVHRLEPLDFLATPTGRIYARWSAWLDRIGLPIGLSQTPHERAAIFAAALPEDADAGWTLTDAYVRERFALEDVDPDTAKRAWRRMIPRLLTARLWRMTERWRRPSL